MHARQSDPAGSGCPRLASRPQFHDFTAGARAFPFEAVQTNPSIPKETNSLRMEADCFVWK